MAAKFVLLFCAQAFIQCISAQCVGAGYPQAGAPFGAPLGAPLGGPLGAPLGGPFGAPLGGPLGAPLGAPLAGPQGACGGALPYGALGAGWEASALAASHGPGLAVTSASPVPPVGVSVASENAIEGALAIGGATPFLGAIGLEGAVPTAGAGAVSYTCSNGEVGILAEDVAAAPMEIAVAPLGFAAAPLSAPLGYPGPAGYGAVAGPYGCAGHL